VLDRMLKKECY